MRDVVHFTGPGSRAEMAPVYIWPKFAWSIIGAFVFRNMKRINTAAELCHVINSRDFKV